MKITESLLKEASAVTIMNTIAAAGGEARLVGGCVRDCFLGRIIHDFDFAVDLIPEKIQHILTAVGITVIPTGLSHGTVTAVIDKKNFELTSLRQDTRCDGRHAVINFTKDWILDASRRDFTFNALYCDVNGKIYDYFNGIDDLAKKKLQFIGDAGERIKEDYLRILRAFRFYADICAGNFLDDVIIKACMQHAHMISALSGERIRDEMFKLLACDKAESALDIMQDNAILQYIIPEKIRCSVLSSAQSFNCNPLLKLALLIRTNETKKQHLSEYLANSWRLSNKQKKRLKSLVNCNLSQDLSLLEQKKNIRRWGCDLYLDMLKILYIETDSDIDKFYHYVDFAQNFNIPVFPLSGEDLLAKGYSGKKLGDSLQKAQQYWEDNEYYLTKEQIMDYIEKLAR